MPYRSSHSICISWLVKIIKDNMSESIWILSIHHWGANPDSTPSTGSTCYATYSSLTFVIHNPCWAGQRFWWHSPNDLVWNLQGTLLRLEKQCPQLEKLEQLIWLDSHTTLQVWIVSTKLSGRIWNELLGDSLMLQSMYFFFFTN